MANATEEFAPQFENEPPKSGSRGCLYGCLAVIVGGILLMVCAGVGGYWFLKGKIEQFTSTEPQQITKVEYSEEQMAELKGRVDTFTAAMEGGEQPEEELVLTAEEINALITASENMSGKVFITIENDEVSGDVSIPLDGVPLASGRYFNGSASLSVSMQNGKLFVSLVDAEVNGEAVPQEVVDAIAAENLAKDAYKDPDSRKVLDRLEDIRVEGDKLILKLKPADESDEASADEVGETSADEVGETSADEVGETSADEAASESGDDAPAADDASGSEESAEADATELQPVDQS